MNELAINVILKFNNKKNRERIIGVNSTFTNCYAIELDTTKFILNEYAIKQLELKIFEGFAEIYEKKESNNFRKNLSEKEKELVEKAWRVIKYIEMSSEYPLIYKKKERRKILAEAGRQFELSLKTTYKYLRKYWQGGMLKGALISERSNCGGKNKDKTLSDEKKFGRTNRVSINQIRLYGIPDSSLLGCNVTDNDKQNIKYAVKNFYGESKKGKRQEHKAAYHSMLEEFYSDWGNDVNGKETRVIWKAKLIITFGQFKYWAKKYISQESVFDKIAKCNDKHYNLNFRGLHGSSTYDAIVSGLVYQIDSTRPPIGLLDVSRTRYIGSPIVYHVVDQFNKYTHGLHVGLYGPCWQGGMTALYNCTEDKKAFCKRYGIDLRDGEWESYGLPAYLVADRGELAGPASEDVIAAFKIGFDTTASGRADLKPDVEKSFDISEGIEFRRLPGVYKDGQNRGDPDFRAQVLLTLDDFIAFCIRDIIFRNKRIIEKFVLTEEMIAHGVRKTPNDIMKWSATKASSTFQNMSDDFIKLNLMKQDKAVLTAKSIYLTEQFQYESETFIKMQWGSKVRMGGTIVIDVCYDERDMSKIYWINRETETFEECKLHKEYMFYSGRSYDEIRSYADDELKVSFDYRDEINNSKSDFDLATSQIVREAQLKFDMNNTSKKPIIKNSKDNREIESKQNKISDAFRCGNEKKSIDIQRDTKAKSLDSPLALRLINMREET